ncbi:hypothetical protein HN371_21910 [Candidatus Poribacteria bacterium]|jgi:hypothetical protein|nr:hypothetical protein [Candidatus Poribacteria bacterium]MBT5536178.1 hypothetical protein [Candidatus Poribacteria bacterium]MBT7097431.1 hypothetical protein [Candidatus Poribacteria bacterium]
MRNIAGLRVPRDTSRLAARVGLLGIACFVAAPLLLGCVLLGCGEDEEPIENEVVTPYQTHAERALEFDAYLQGLGIVWNFDSDTAWLFETKDGQRRAKYAEFQDLTREGESPTTGRVGQFEIFVRGDGLAVRVDWAWEVYWADDVFLRDIDEPAYTLNPSYTRQELRAERIVGGVLLDGAVFTPF